MSANFCLIKVYGTNPCTARCDVKILNDSFKENSTEGFALLDGKTRQEMDVSQFKYQMFPPAAVKQMGIDQQIIILRPDLKLSYNIYPHLKSYVKTVLSGDAATSGKEPKMESTEIGREMVDGHPCVKKKVVVTTGDGEKHEVLVWLATDLKNFPIKVQTTSEGSIEVSTYKQIQFVKPDAKLFEPPAGFTEYADFDEMMDKTQTNRVADLSDTNEVSADSERLDSIVEFTLKNGTNRPVGPATAKAFGLGDEKIPATQIILGRKDETLVHFFGVSMRNTNDFFIACIDQKTRNGTVWLTSRAGKIRATILTSTNSPPKAVTNDRYADQFEEELNFFLQFVTPPPWEDAPHPLNVVAKFGDLSDVEKILKRDIKSINAQDDEGMTPLACAIVQEQMDVARFLLDKGANPEIPNKNGLTPLELAASRPQTNGLLLCELLLAKGAQVNPTNKTDYRITPLDWAVSSDNIELVKLLLDHGADGKAKSDVGSTALHTAADRGDKEIAAMLIEHGADVNAKVTGGTTPLHEAAWAGRDEVIKLLLSKGAEVDPKRHDGLTPLISAADREHNSTVEILLANGADINAAMDNGDTALHSAIARGNKEVVETLLAHGADMNLKNKAGETVLQFAAKCHQPAMVELLRKHGAQE